MNNYVELFFTNEAVEKKKELASKCLLGFDTQQEYYFHFHLHIGNLKYGLDDIERCNILTQISNPYVNRSPAETPQFRQQMIQLKTGILHDLIKENVSLRLWADNDVESQCAILYVSNMVYLSKTKLYIASLEKEQVEVKEITDKEIKKNSYKWNDLVSNSTELRALLKDDVKNVSVDYYDMDILKLLKGNKYLQKDFNECLRKNNFPVLWCNYRINCLIDSNIITILKDGKLYFERIIALNI